MRRSNWFVTSALIVMLGALFTIDPTVTHAAVPNTLNFQAVLVDALGNPVTTPVNITLKVYADSIGGTALATETHLVTPDIAGAVGSGRYESILSDSGTTGTARWLGVTVGSDPEMAPRTKLGSVPFAHLTRGVSGDIETGMGHLTIPAGSDSVTSFAMLAPDGDTIYSLTCTTTTTGALGKISSDPFAVTVKSSKSNNSSFRTIAHSDGSLTQMVFLGATVADTLFSVSTSATGALSKNPDNPFASNLNTSKSNINRVVTNSGPSGNSIVFHDTLGNTTISITDTLATFKNVMALGGNGWLTSGNTLTGSSASPNEWIGSVSNHDWIVRTNNSERMRVNSGGSVGIGTTNPSAPLEIGSSALRGVVRVTGSTSQTPALTLKDSRIGGNEWIMYSGESTIGDFTIYDVNAGSSRLVIRQTTGNVGIGTITPNEKLSIVGNICATGTITGTSGGCGVSDARFKKNVATLNDGLGLVLRLRGVRYDWDRERFPERHFSDAPQVGFIAQELKEVMPELVTKMSDGYYAVDYGRLAPVLVEAIKELKVKTDRIAELEKKTDRIAELEKKTDQIATLQTKVAELQELVQKLALQSPHTVTTAQVER